MQYSAVNKFDCGRASRIGHEGKKVTGLVQCCAIDESDFGKATVIVHEGK